MKNRIACCGCLALPVIVVLHSMLHAFQSAHSAAQSSRVLGAFHRINRAVLLYAIDHQDRIPGPNWSDEIRRYDGTLDQDLRIDLEESGIGFAMMPGLSGRRTFDLNPGTILLVEYRTNLSNAIALDPKAVIDRSDNGYARVSTVDGRVDVRLPIDAVRARIAKR